MHLKKERDGSVIYGVHIAEINQQMTWSKAQVQLHPWPRFSFEGDPTPIVSYEFEPV